MAGVKVLHEQIHVTAVLVAHDQQEAMELAEPLIVMRAGTSCSQATHCAL
ncbi:MAG: hypothetical protein ACRDVC_01730 [Acidimicrobiales bacterium]